MVGFGYVVTQAMERWKGGEDEIAVHSHKGNRRSHPGLGPAAHRGQWFSRDRAGRLGGSGGDATDLVIGDNAERMEGVGVPPMRELLGKLREHEVPVYV